MQNKTKNIFFKIISGLVLIQGVLQLLNLLGLVGYGRTTTSATKFYLGLVLIGGYAVAAMVGGYTVLKMEIHRKDVKDVFMSVLY